MDIKSKTKVSIIIPTYNRASIITETLDSILAQNYPNWECIIIDDGSNDNTKEVVNSYVVKDSRFNFFIRPNNYKPGSCGARNYGLTLAKGELIQQFDSDDLMHKDLISEKVAIFNTNPDIQSVISRLTFFEGNKILKTQKPFNQKFENLYENIITYNVPVWTVSIMFRKQFLIDCHEKYDETLIFNDDLDLFSRIFIKHPHKTYLLDKPLCFIRRNNAGSMTTLLNNNNLGSLKSEIKANEKVVNLLIDEKVFTKNLEKHYYLFYKRLISKLAKISAFELIDYCKTIVESMLLNQKQNIKLVRFRLGLSLIKIIPLDNVFLLYRRPTLLQFFYQNTKRIYRVLFEKSYLRNKFQEKDNQEFIISKK
jgi:glycosyltransferase involved in cell wall biosynthesis